MKEQLDRVVSSSTPAGVAEERIVRADLVREMVARAQRSEARQANCARLDVLKSPFEQSNLVVCFRRASPAVHNLAAPR